MKKLIVTVNGVYELSSRQYEGEDDCLAAALADVAEATGLETWELEARWEDNDNREVIQVRKTSR